jgi:hypothetical protein
LSHTNRFDRDLERVLSSDQIQHRRNNHKGNLMNRVIVMVSLSLMLATTACKKKEEAKPAPASNPPTPAATAPAAEPPAAKPTTPPEGAIPVDMTIEAACDRTAAMLTAMGDAVTATKDNCEAMGTALEKWAADHKAFLEWAKAAEKDKAKNKEFKAKCEPKMKPVMDKVGPALEGASKCKNNEKVKAALADLG